MNWFALLTLAAGLVLLTMGAELFVRAASALAARFRISPLVIGLTVVAFGTSAPELAVSLQAGFSGNPNIAVANVVGSNIFNVLFILGVCAVIAPLTVAQQLVRTDVPIMIGVSLLVWWMATDGAIGKLSGLLLTLGICAYTGWLIKAARGAPDNAADCEQAAAHTPAGTTAARVPIHALTLLAGVLLLVLGARWMVSAAVSLASGFGVDDTVIGLTIIAAGTSLPEVATSLVATFRGERDIAIGNVIGSNLFNLMAILGLSALLTPAALTVDPALLQRDIPVMVVAALLCLPILFTGGRIARSEGALFLGAYVLYTLYLIMGAGDRASLELLETVALFGLAPPIILVLAISAAREMRARRRNGPTG